MGHPLFLSFAGLVLGEAAAILWGKNEGLFAALGILLAAMAFAVWRKYRSPFFLFLLVWLMIGYGAGHSAFYENRGVNGIALPIETKIYGRIIFMSEKEKKHTFILENVSVRDKMSIRLKGKCLVYMKKQENSFQPGDWILCRGKLCGFDAPTNPGEFRGDIYQKARGIYSCLFAENCRIVKREKWSLPGISHSIRRRIGIVFHNVLRKEEASMLQAMVLGDKTEISVIQSKLYADNGVAHLLAISGLHVSILAGGWFRMLRKLHCPYFISCFCGCAFLLFYVLMTGFGNSSIRAGLMYAVYLGAEYLGVEYDLPSAMGLAGILMLLESPWRLLEGGFQISFVMIAVIGLVLPWADRLWEQREEQEERKWRVYGEARKTIKKAIYSSVILSAATTPLFLRIFFEWTPYSILLNPVMIPLMAPLMLSGILCGLSGLICMPLAVFLSIPAQGLLQFFSFLLRFTEKLPGTPMVSGCPSIRSCVMIYVTELLLAVFWYCKKYKELFLTGLAAALLVFCFAGKPFLQIIMMDVGQGEAVLIKTPEGRGILVDGGSTSRSRVGTFIIEPVLKYYGIGELDTVMITHADEDHINGIIELLEGGYPVKTICMQKGWEEDAALQPVLALAKQNRIKTKWISEGDSFIYGNHISLTCLHPGDTFVSENRNEASLVLHLNFRKFDMLLTGDLEGKGEEALRRVIKEKNYSFHGELEILKVAHHGSGFSTTEQFLDEALPRAGILSAGKNNRYGHPHPELLKRIKDRGISLWRTDEAGAISLKSDGESWSISTYVLPTAQRGSGFLPK